MATRPLPDAPKPHDEPVPTRLRLLPGAATADAERSRLPLVVFLGIDDDRRSRLAAGLLLHRARGRVGAVSMSPTTVRPDPAVAAAAAEIGVDLGALRSTPFSRELVERATVLVVMGYDAADITSTVERGEDWCIDDPVGKDPKAIACIRDALDRRVRRLLARLGIAAAREGDA